MHYLAWAFVSSLPLVVLMSLGYRRWRKHYGKEHGLLGYYLRYMTARTATEDPFALGVLKMLVILVWVAICGLIFQP